MTFIVYIIKANAKVTEMFYIALSDRNLLRITVIGKFAVSMHRKLDANFLQNVLFG